MFIYFQMLFNTLLMFLTCHVVKNHFSSQVPSEPYKQYLHSCVPRETLTQILWWCLFSYQALQSCKASSSHSQMLFTCGVFSSTTHKFPQLVAMVTFSLKDTGCLNISSFMGVEVQGHGQAVPMLTSWSSVRRCPCVNKCVFVTCGALWNVGHRAGTPDLRMILAVRSQYQIKTNLRSK